MAVEAASFVSFAGLQGRFLRAGGATAPIAPLVGVTLSAQAINNSLPGGTVLAAIYGFRWYRRFGADEAVAGWAMVGTMVAAVVSLAIVAAGGVALAAEESTSYDLLPVVVGVLGVALFIGTLFLYERPLGVVATWALRACQRLTGRPKGTVADHLRRIVERVSVVRLGWRDVGAVLGWGLGNWLLDGACFALCFPAIGAGVPWEGLFLAYGAGQLAANLPITPGGLGAVEGSITIALVAFGGDKVSSVDAVLVYRLISFWAELVIGWSAAAALGLRVRAGRWPRLGTLKVTVPPASANGWHGAPLGPTGQIAPPLDVAAGAAGSGPRMAPAPDRAPGAGLPGSQPGERAGT